MDKTKKHLIFVLNGGVLAALALLVVVTLPFYTFAAWAGGCTWSAGEGSDLTVTAGNTCTLTGTGTADSITVDTGGTLEIGDGAGTGGDLIVNTIGITIEGDLNIDSDSSLENIGVGDFIVQNGGTVTNDGTINNLTQKLNVYDDTTTFTNNGTLNTYILEVGDVDVPYSDGGTYTNNGVTNVTNDTIGGSGVEIYEGLLANNNSDLGVTSFRYESRLRMLGTAAETSVFQNLGVVDAGQDNISMSDYTLLDLNGGRFVMNEEGCVSTPPDAGYINMRSLSGNASDVLIDIASGASLSGGAFEIGWDGDGSSAKLINAGTIEKIDVAGNPLDCPINFVVYNDSEVENNGGTIKLKGDRLFLTNNSTWLNGTGALLDIGDNYLDLFNDVTLTNEAGATIAALPAGNAEFRLVSDTAVINNSGEIRDFKALEIRGASTGLGGTFNAFSGSTTNVRSFAVGNQSADVGGTANIDAGAQVTATNQIGAEGYGVINADGQIDASLAFSAFGGVTEGGATINLNDTSDVYEFGALLVDGAKSGYTSSINIGPGVELDLTTPADPGLGYYLYGAVGFNTADGNNELNVNGTLRMIDDPVNSARFLVSADGNGSLNIGPDGFVDFNDSDGWIEVLAPAPYGLIDNSDDLLTEGVDCEGEVLVSGNYETNNRLDAVNLLHIQAGGEMHSGMDSVVTIEGSDTIVDGFYELDGTLNAGNLTVNNGGLISSSGDDEVSLTTNFLLNVENLIVNTGGKIASDAVSSYLGLLAGAGPGSYGGTGEGRPIANVYGQAKMDETNIPTYGEAGTSGGPIDAKGGGGVRIHATGDITIDGQISANGGQSTNVAGGSGSGGTVILIHEPTDPGAVFNGSGVISANGGGATITGVPVAAGGRVVIESPLIDYPDMGSYDFTGTVEVYPGNNSFDGDSAAAGTLVYLGDVNNPNGSLIVDQNSLTTLEQTYIPNTGDIIFDRIEVLGGGKVTWEADPGTPPVVCYETDGTITFNVLNCADYQFGDKPDTLYMAANSAQTVDPEQEPGYQAADGVENANLVIAAERPVFSVMYRNPVDFSAIEKLQVQIDNDADFSSPIWDYEKINLTKADGTDVLPNERTKDIRYNEDGTALSTLIPGTTYYIRVRFITNPPGLWNHSDYNDQYRFTTNPPAPQPPSGGGGGGGAGSFYPGTFPSPVQPPEEPTAPQEPVEEPAEEPAAPQEPAEEPVVEPAPAPTPIPEQPQVILPQTEEPGRIKVPVKRPSAPEQETTSIYPEGSIEGCTRADLVERIINEFNLYDLLKQKDEKCLANLEYCLLPFIIHSNHTFTEQSYYPDVLSAEDLVGDSNPLPPMHSVDEGVLVSDSNPLPIRLADAINFATRQAMVQGYYEEPGSPFKPFENMNRIEILKLLNWVIGQQWEYFEEFVTELGGEKNLINLTRNAIDLNEWWHIRYHNFACDSGLLDCNTEGYFEPLETCSSDWLDGMISKYKQYYDENNISEQFVKDTDNDSIIDEDENNIFSTNPEEEDTDNDNLNDGEEIITYKTSPLLTDSDSDNIDDGDEILVYKTNPLNPDTDGDGVSDGIELSYGTDPNNPESKPADLNENGIPDDWELKYNIKPADGTVDTDKDGLSDLLEFRYKTNPLNPDTDEDGLTDAEEVLLYGTDPLKPTNLSEIGVQIINIKDGSVLTDKYPTIRGLGPKPDMEILLVLKNEFGHELLLGKTKTDENNLFVFKSEIELQNGQFYLMAKGLDSEISTVINSPLIFITLDSEFDIKEPKPERLNQTLITDEVLLQDLSVEVDDKKPVLYGSTGFENRVIATWQSVLGVSSIVADIAGGEFSIPSPEEMPLGKHKVTVYSIQEDTQAISKDVVVNFDVVEPQIVVSHEAAMPQPEEGLPIWLWIILGTIVVGIVGFGYSKIKKKK